MKAATSGTIGSGSVKQSQIRSIAKTNVRNAFWMAVAIFAAGVAFVAWVAWIANLPAKCWSVLCSPIDVSAAQVECGKEPYQHNWILKDY